MESNKYMSPVSAWAFAVGTSIGWGSFFITSNTYLYNAGALGSVLGLLIGADVMLFIAHNYQFMMNCFQDSGGAFSYTKEIFGHDYGFLVSSFLILTYCFPNRIPERKNVEPDRTSNTRQIRRLSIQMWHSVLSIRHNFPSCAVSSTNPFRSLSGTFPCISRVDSDCGSPSQTVTLLHLTRTL